MTLLCKNNPARAYNAECWMFASDSEINTHARAVRWNFARTILLRNKQNGQPLNPQALTAYQRFTPLGALFEI